MPTTFLVFILGTLGSFLALVWAGQRLPRRLLRRSTGRSSSATPNEDQVTDFRTKGDFVRLLRMEAIRRVDRSLASLIEARLVSGDRLEPAVASAGSSAGAGLQQTASLVETLFSRQHSALYRDKAAILSGPQAGSRATMERLRGEVVRGLEDAVRGRARAGEALAA